MKIDDLIQVKIGRNLSRGSVKDNISLVPYSYEDLINDLDGLFLYSQVSTNSMN